MPLPPQAEARVQKHSFHIKFDYQLEAMLVLHTSKLNHLREPGGDLEKYTQDADGMVAVRWEIKEQFPDLSPAERGQEFFDQQAYYIWKDVMLQEVIDTIPIEQDARAQGIVNRNPLGTTYYVDGDAGNNGSDGLTTGNAWLDIDQFTENARSAGDICIVRRATTIDNASDLLFTSDGTIGNPIIIKADNDNAFSDDVDLSATATATLTFGSKTITFSADISGVLSAGDWIYAASDDSDDFAYEVLSVSTVTVTLYIPYKGAQAGAGKTMTNMLANPIWNTASGNFQWNFDVDYAWQVRGIHIRGTDVNGNVELDGCLGHEFFDCIFEGNGSSDKGINSNDDGSIIYVSKCRFFNHDNSHRIGGAASALAVFRDCLFDGNSVSFSQFVTQNNWGKDTCIDCEFMNFGSEDINMSATQGIQEIYLRNCVMDGATEISVDIGLGGGRVFVEDHDNTLNDTRYFSRHAVADTTPMYQSETTKVRSGGGAITLKVTPGAGLGTNVLGRQLLFEYPIYATTDSKTYTVYFASNATTDWTANPTASELFIELEYWAHSTNKSRSITKSTGSIDFTTDTDFDQTLTVTVAPSQTGVAFLRCYYGKAKESGKSNVFFCDPRIEIT